MASLQTRRLSMPTPSSSYSPNGQNHHHQQQQQQQNPVSNTTTAAMANGIHIPPLQAGPPLHQIPHHSGHSLGQQQRMAPNANMFHKAASTRAVMMSPPQNNNDMSLYQSPVPNRMAGKLKTHRSRSLIGFDPLLSDNTSSTTPAATTMPSSAPSTTAMNGLGPTAFHSSMPTMRTGPIQQSSMAISSMAAAPVANSPMPNRKQSSPPTIPNTSNHVTSVPSTPVKMVQPLQRKASTPVPNRVTKKPVRHNREAFSLSAVDLHSISQEAADDEDEKKEERQLGEMIAKTTDGTASPKKPKEGGAMTKEQPKKEIMSARKDIPKPIAMEKEASTPKKESQDEQQNKDESELSPSRRSSVTPPRTRKLPWQKKGHRRTKSLESKDDSAANVASKEKRSSMVNAPATVGGGATEQKSSMYPAIVHDLMGISFDKLQIPTLAKPSPTSFLTGKEDEVVRTCEMDPSLHQMEIPTLPEFVVTARLNEFVENYRRVDQNLNLKDWVGLDRMSLRQVRIPQHKPIVQSLLECGDDVVLQGFVTKGANAADTRIEAAIFQGQRQFTAVFRGTTEQQTKPASNKNKKTATAPLDAEHANAEVFACFRDEYLKLEPECFALLDKLTEENPFTDVVFTGHSFGAAMATLAAFRYANARPMMRVSCLVLGSPKVGFSAFRQLVNSLPNLKVMRLEFGQDGKCQTPASGGTHVGHTLVLHGSLGHNSLKINQPVLAYKFETPKYKKFKTTHPDLRSYVNGLEEIARLGLAFVKDFVGVEGKGVIVNNETRQVV